MHAGLKVDQVDHDGHSALHLACMYGDLDVDTAKHMVGSGGRYEIVRILVEEGDANITLPDRNGNTAWDLCIYEGNYTLMDLLLDDKLVFM